MGFTDRAASRAFGKYFNRFHHSVERQVGQVTDGPGNVEQLGIGVDVGSQSGVAVPHGGLRRA